MGHCMGYQVGRRGPLQTMDVDVAVWGAEFGKDVLHYTVWISNSGSEKKVAAGCSWRG
jgi:hypothetical protein